MWGTSADVCALQFKERKCEIDENEVEKRSSLQIRVSAVQNYSAGERGETLTQSQNEIGEQILQAVLAYHPKRNNGSCVNREIMCIFSKNAWVAIVVRRFWCRRKTVEDTTRAIAPIHTEESGRLRRGD